MTDNSTLNIICAIIVGLPMFYVAWRILKLIDNK